MRVANVQPRRGFTLVELLVVVSIIALLIGILVPSLRGARQQGIATLCVANLRSLGQGLTMYATDHNDALPPGRLPDLGDGMNWRTEIAGGLKYRPTFLAVMGGYVGVPAFADPQTIKSSTDRFGEPGNQQNYFSKVYVCPAVPTWTDERNGAYGYNYQFLGNSRLLNTADAFSFKNWPVRMAQVKSPARCVAVADSMGTAASFAAPRAYGNNTRDVDRLGNEGFNLDPPRVDPTNGEMADLDGATPAQSAVHGRHRKQASVLWVDTHVDTAAPTRLGYVFAAHGVVTHDGTNHLFNIRGEDRAWTVSPAP